MLDVADAAVLGIQIEGVAQRCRCENDGGGHASGGGLAEVLGLRQCLTAADVPVVQDDSRIVAWTDRGRRDRAARAVELAQDREDAAGAVHVLDEVVLGVGSHLADARHMAAEVVDVVLGESGVGLLGGGQQVQDRVGRAAHGDVERHGVLERLRWRSTRQHRVVVLVVPAACEISTIGPAGLPEQTSRSLCVASVVPLPGSARPSASVRQFIELAVNMPEHEPQVGHALASIAAICSSLTSLSTALIMASIRSRRFDWVPSSIVIGRPDSIGPPETKTVGMFSRSAAISMPGVILSQLEMQIMASALVRVDHVLDRVGDDARALGRL